MARDFTPEPSDAQRLFMTGLGFRLQDSTEDAKRCTWIGHGLEFECENVLVPDLATFVAEMIKRALSKGRADVRNELQKALGLKV